MYILPAIDLKDGKVVRLYKGDFNKVHQVAQDPLETARAFSEAGARWIHMVLSLIHILLMVQYLQNNGGKVTLEAIAKPDRELTSRLRVLELGLEHERYVTGLIHTLYEAAYSAKDFRTMQFLDWFVKEQGEEEKNAEDLIKKMKLYGEDAKGLYMLNSEMAARVYTAPSLVL